MGRTDLRADSLSDLRLCSVVTLSFDVLSAQIYTACAGIRLAWQIRPMRDRAPFVLLLAVVAFLTLAGDTHSSPGFTSRVSVASDGTQGNFASQPIAISADGRFVSFQSLASNLVPGDTNGSVFAGWDVFVHDRLTGATERVSVDSAGGEAFGDSFGGALSADGRFVAFYSSAPDLVARDRNGVSDVFVHDRQTGSTERVSVPNQGNETNGNSSGPVISADGRFVAFESRASNLVNGDINICSSFTDPGTCPDIFVYDRQTGVSERVSVDSAGGQANADSSGGVSISADGRFVAFESSASNLVPGDTNLCGASSCADVFVRDRQTATTERVSVDSFGGQASGHSIGPAISDDGRFVAFHSFASNLVSGDTNGKVDVFVHDRQTGSMERVSVDGTGSQGDGDSSFPAVSGDGRFVAFGSAATNLVSDDTNSLADAFVHDRVTGATIRVSLDSSDNQANGESGASALISETGRFAAFGSVATNLVSGDTNGASDVYVRDLGDADGDGAWDAFDNCPSWPNPGQNLPPWTVPVNDPDCDGFSTSVENRVGTSALVHCGTNAWPPDINNDTFVDVIGDISQVAGQFGNRVPPAPARYDIAPDPPDGVIDVIGDISRLAGLFGQHCT